MLLTGQVLADVGRGERDVAGDTAMDTLCLWPLKHQSPRI
jgi:hypothetical protein